LEFANIIRLEGILLMVELTKWTLNCLKAQPLADAGAALTQTEQPLLSWDFASNQITCSIHIISDLHP